MKGVKDGSEIVIVYMIYIVYSRADNTPLEYVWKRGQSCIVQEWNIYSWRQEIMYSIASVNRAQDVVICILPKVLVQSIPMDM